MEGEAVWGRLATAGNAGRDNLTIASKNVKRRSSHRLEAAARSYAHRAYTSALRWGRAGRGVLVEVRAEDGVMISQEDNDKQRRALFMRGKGVVQGANQKQRNALLVKKAAKRL